MFKQIKHGGIALLVFVVLTSLFLWMTGTFSRGKADPHAEVAKAEAHDDDAKTDAKAPAPKDDCCPPPGGAPATREAHADEKDAHDHGKEAKAPKARTIAEIETVKCEHNIRQLDCSECRYELGVVKVQPSVTAALVTTDKAQKRELVQKLRVTGEVQFDQTRVVDVVPVTAGRIISIKARLGQQVKQGDILAVIHSSEFGEAKVAYLDAATSFEIASKEQARQVAINIALEKMIARLASAKDTGILASGTELASDIKQPLGEWRSKLIGAAARLQKARIAHDREKTLLGKQASSKADFEEAVREFQTAQAEYDALVEEVQLSLNITKLKADNATRQAEAKTTAAEQRLHMFGLDDPTIKAIGQAHENGNFAQLEIKAPRAGTITAGNVAEGRYMDNAHSMFTVADLSNLWVWCDVYERDLAALHEKLVADNTAKATVTVPAYAAAPFVGAVDLVGSALDEHTRTIKVRVQLANPQGKLKPGMFATVDIELPTGRQAVMVPANAVLNDEGKFFAFEHWKDDLWLKRDVTVGHAQDGLVQIDGIAPGATVATNGAFLFKSDVLRAKMGAGCAD